MKLNNHSCYLCRTGPTNVHDGHDVHNVLSGYGLHCPNKNVVYVVAVVYVVSGAGSISKMLYQ
jgi:hypothetical protein